MKYDPNITPPISKFKENREMMKKQALDEMVKAAISILNIRLQKKLNNPKGQMDNKVSLCMLYGSSELVINWKFPLPTIKRYKIPGNTHNVKEFEEILRRIKEYFEPKGYVVNHSYYLYIHVYY